MGTAEPLLHERARGREDEIGDAEGNGEKRENLQGRVAAAEGLPGLGGSNRQQRKGRAEQAEMDDNLNTRFEPAGAEMRISVSGQQDDLEEQQAGGPNTRSAAKPG